MTITGVEMEEVCLNRWRYLQKVGKGVISEPVMFCLFYYVFRELPPERILDWEEVYRYSPNEELRVYAAKKCEGEKIRMGGGLDITEGEIKKFFSDLMEGEDKLTLEQIYRITVGVLPSSLCHEVGELKKLTLNLVKERIRGEEEEEVLIEMLWVGCYCLNKMIFERVAELWKIG